MPLSIVHWLASFLSDRSMILTLLEGPMGEFPMPTGILQGYLLSPILYLFYNANLLDKIYTAHPGKATVTRYIDDIFIPTWGNSAVANARLLRDIHNLVEK